MSSNAVAITAIVMTGLLLCVIAWQLLGIARAAVARRSNEEFGDLGRRIDVLEQLHPIGAVEHDGGEPA